MARVLVVDDARLARRILINALVSAGHDVVSEASDGNVAVDEYRKHKPDLIMMDVTMPGTNGIEASRKILLEDPGAKVIMVTASNRESIVRASRDSGAVGYVVKPYHKDRILEVVDRVLANSTRPTPAPAAEIANAPEIPVSCETTK